MGPWTPISIFIGCVPSRLSERSRLRRFAEGWTSPNIEILHDVVGIRVRFAGTK